MIIHNLEQGSQEWLDFKDGKIGSSDSSAIFALSPWDTPYSLWKKRKDRVQSKVNFAMEKGKMLEPVGRDLFISQTGISVSPLVVQHDSRLWQMASLDGISEDRKTVIEIKCLGRELWEMAQNGEIPVYYKCQLHHIALVAEMATTIFYVVYFEGQIKIIEFQFEPAFAADLLKAEEEFLLKEARNEPPELTEKDYSTVEDTEGSKLLQEYLSLDKAEKDIEKKKEEIKAQLISLNPQGNFILDGVKFYQTQNASYDFSAMKSQGINLDEYKKFSKPFWKISPPRSRKIA